MKRVRFYFCALSFVVIAAVLKNYFHSTEYVTRVYISPLLKASGEINPDSRKDIKRIAGEINSRNLKSLLTSKDDRNLLSVYLWNTDDEKDFLVEVKTELPNTSSKYVEEIYWYLYAVQSRYEGSLVTKHTDEKVFSMPYCWSEKIELRSNEEVYSAPCIQFERQDASPSIFPSSAMFVTSSAIIILFL